MPHCAPSQPIAQLVEPAARPTAIPSRESLWCLRTEAFTPPPPAANPKTDSDGFQQRFVVLVGAHPEPNHCVVLENPNSPPIEINPGQINRQVVVHLFEPQRRMFRISTPEPVGPANPELSLLRGLGVELAELFGGDRFHSNGTNGSLSPASCSTSAC